MFIASAEHTHTHTHTTSTHSSARQSDGGEMDMEYNVDRLCIGLVCLVSPAATRLEPAGRLAGWSKAGRRPIRRQRAPACTNSRPDFVVAGAAAAAISHAVFPRIAPIGLHKRQTGPSRAATDGWMSACYPTVAGVRWPDQSNSRKVVSVGCAALVLRDCCCCCF